MLGLPIMHCTHPNINLCLSFLRININKPTRHCLVIIIIIIKICSAHMLGAQGAETEKT